MDDETDEANKGTKKEGEEEQIVKVSMKTRLDNRIIDLRTPAK